MVVFPLILNAIYFWIVDSILKFSPEESDKDIKELYENPDENAANTNTNPTLQNQNNDEMPNDVSPPCHKKEIDSLTNKLPNDNNIETETKVQIGYTIELPEIEDNKV